MSAPVGRAGGQRFDAVTARQPDNDYPIVALGSGSPRTALPQETGTDPNTTRA